MHPMNRIPDAVLIPEDRKSGTRMSDRAASILAIAEPLLQVDRSRGQKGYIRIQPQGRLFVTRDPRDTLLFPTGHPCAGQPRYDWVSLSDGIELGYLREHPPHA